MAKYRGKHNGQTRGPYVQEKFRSIQNSSDDIFDLHEQLHHFFHDKGYCIDSCTDHNDTYLKRCFTYHIAGASIGMEAIDYKAKTGSVPQHFVDLTLVSNDSLDDIVKNILEKFPMFKKR